MDEIHTPSIFCLCSRPGQWYTYNDSILLYPSADYVNGGYESEQLPTVKQLKDEKEPGEELTVKKRAKSKSKYAQGKKK